MDHIYFQSSMLNFILSYCVHIVSKFMKENTRLIKLVWIVIYTYEFLCIVKEKTFDPDMRNESLLTQTCIINLVSE